MDYLGRGKASRTQPFALAITLVIHLALFYFVSEQLLPHGQQSITENAIHYINISPVVETELSIALPDFNTSSSPRIEKLPIVDNVQIGDEPTNLYESSGDTYQFPDKNAGKFQHLFDPRLRDRLQNLKHFTKSKTRSVDGVQILDLGDGNCEFTTVGTSKTGRMSESVVVKCGNNESEQMVENMEKALQDPLGLR